MEAARLVDHVELDTTVASEPRQGDLARRRGAARCRRGCRAPARAAAGRRRRPARSRRSRRIDLSELLGAPLEPAPRPTRRARRRRAARPRSGSRPRSERAISSRSSASWARRSASWDDQRTASRAPRPSRAWRSASSSSVRSSASGVRSSWPASATKSRSRSSASSSRVEHLVQRLAEPLELVAGRRDGQPLAGRLGRDRAARRRIDSTGRSATPGEQVAERARRGAGRSGRRSSSSSRKLASVSASFSLRRADDEHERPAVARRRASRAGATARRARAPDGWFDVDRRRCARPRSSAGERTGPRPSGRVASRTRPPRRAAGRSSRPRSTNRPPLSRRARRPAG